MDARDHERGQANAARETVRVRLLGGFRLAVGRREVPNEAWRLRKAQALVKLLALAPGHALHREQAMDLLWPNLGRKAASNNLRGALHAARQALDPDRRRGPAGLDSEGERIALCPEGNLWVDVEAFEASAASARGSQEPAPYEAAIGLYAGDLLPEDR